MRLQNIGRTYTLALIALLSIILPTAAVARQTADDPPPLRKHIWLANPILIQFGFVGGDGAAQWQAQFPHEFVLYADGTLIKTMTFRDTPVIYQSKLNRREVCQWLYTIEQTGFLELIRRRGEENGQAMVAPSAIALIGIMLALLGPALIELMRFLG